MLGLIRHYREEFLFVNLSILVEVKFIDHCLSIERHVSSLGRAGSEALKSVQFIIFQPIAYFLGYSPEVAQTNLACIVVVE